MWIRYHLSALTQRFDAVLLDKVVMDIPGFLWSDSDSILFFDVTLYNMHNETIPPSSPGHYFYYLEVRNSRVFKLSKCNLNYCLWLSLL